MAPDRVQVCSVNVTQLRASTCRLGNEGRFHSLLGAGSVETGRGSEGGPQGPSEPLSSGWGSGLPQAAVPGQQGF